MGHTAYNIPTQFTARTTFHLPCADGVTLYLRGPSAIDIESNNGALSVSATQTAQWIPGYYKFSLRKTDDNGTISEISSGSIQILPDITALKAGSDMRSQARRSYDAVCAVLEKRASLDQQEYKINNRELKRTPINDLIRLRSYYARLVRKEEGVPFIREHKVWF